MSSCSVDHVPAATAAATAVVPEQLCYIPCSFCNIVLAVSVPCSSLFDIVTVRCGHCTNLWSVNMAAAAFQYHQALSASTTTTTTTAPSSNSSIPRQLDLHPLHHHNRQVPNYNNSDYRINNDHLGSPSSKYFTDKMLMRPTPTPERTVNRPPEKRQRVPSAYNQFIKEEIQRIKANNPDISHREAFSTAAKNWAHFPHIHFGLMLEPNNQPRVNEGAGEKHLMPRAQVLNN